MPFASGGVGDVDFLTAPAGGLIDTAGGGCAASGGDGKGCQVATLPVFLRSSSNSSYHQG
jgi:hypothetical protein